VGVCLSRLQYKYMKLVASAGGSGKLPVAETCAIDDGEDEDYDDDDDEDHDGRDFAATKVRKGVRFFHKLTMSPGPSNDAKVCQLMILPMPRIMLARVITTHCMAL